VALSARESWGAATGWDEVCRRAAGRRHHNAHRRTLQLYRRMLVSHLILRYGYYRGIQVRIARELGVSEATISRDVRAMWHPGRPVTIPASWTREREEEPG